MASNALQAAVVAVEDREIDGKPVAHFQVQATIGDRTKTRWYTLEDFQALEKQIAKMFPTRQKEVPHVFKPYVIRQHLIDHDQLNNARREKLDIYIKGLVAIPDIGASFPVQYFLRVHDMRGQVVLITGANTGIGKVTAQAIADMGGHVIMACRSESRAAPAIQEIIEKSGNSLVEFMQLDLGSLQSVRDFVAAYDAKGLPLHVLVNNAGAASGPVLKTVDGFEHHLGVNHLGMVLLTELLKPKLISSAPSRVIVVSSHGHEKVKYSDLDWSKAREPSATSFNPAFKQYQVSKLANSLYAAELAERIKGSGVAVFHIHPGVIKSEFLRAAPKWIQMITSTFVVGVEEGALTQIMLAAQPGVEVHAGKYFKELIESPPNPCVLVAENRHQCLVETCKLIDYPVPA